LPVTLLRFTQAAPVISVENDLNVIARARVFLAARAQLG
jgi:hypothetical protein